jgi:hypothetical protein
MKFCLLIGWIVVYYIYKPKKLKYQCNCLGGMSGERISTTRNEEYCRLKLMINVKRDRREYSFGKFVKHYVSASFGCIDMV